MRLGTAGMCDYGTKNNIKLLLILSFFFYSFDYFFRISQGIIVTPLMHQYHTDSMGIGIFASAFYLAYAACQLPCGYLLDRYPTSILFATSIILCSIAYIAFLFSHIFWLGYVLRALIGATSAISFLGILYLSRTFLSQQCFSLVAAFAISVGTVSASVAQVLGAWAMQHMDWHYALMIPGIMAMVVGLLFFTIKNLPKPTEKIYTKISLSELKFLLKPILLGNAVIGSLFYLPTSIFASLWGVSFLETHYYLSKTQASMGIMWLFLGWAIGSPLMGAFANRYHYYHRLISGFALLGMAIALLIVYMPQLSLSVLMGSLFLFGLFSSAQAIVWKVFDSNAPQRLNGIGIAWTSMIIILGSALFHLLVGYLLTLNILQNDQHQIDYQLGLAILPLTFLLVAITATQLKK